MAQTQPTTSPGKTATAAPAKTPAAPAQLVFAQPLVLRRKKKRKKKFTRGLKDIQGWSQGVFRATSRLSEAGYRAFRVLDKKSGRSARRKRDGGIRDLLKNATLAAGKGLSTASKAPYDVLRRVNTKVVWRQTRPFAKTIYGMVYPLNNFFR